MKYARNAFSRWDAAQALLGRYIKENVARVQNAKPFFLKWLMHSRSIT